MNADSWVPLQFIDDPITVHHPCPPTLEKKPEAPQSFDWHGTTFLVVDVLSTWFDYQRRGREARNMAPQHAQTAQRRGSWGVGRFYFRVRTDDGRAFDLYYDRAPTSAGDRKGHWFLYRELRQDVPPPWPSP